MNDSVIKSYCMWARRELISEVKRRCAIYDISENPSSTADADAVGGFVLTAAEKEQRKELLATIREEGHGRVAERAAYTWFNRIMAIRFMEVNDLLPSRTRVLSANDGSFKPQVLTEALSVDIEGLDRVHVAELVQAGDDEATFRYLFLTQCAELANCMPDVFEDVGAAVELLLPDGLLREGGVVNRCVVDIPEDDWREGVQIVGWMYQYYVSEKKDDYFASKRKASAEDIPCATQLFTPEWIVRYLTENSLGRLWMLNSPQSELASKMDYYLVPEGDAGGFLRIEGPEEITVLDPACGSGHILVYAFDLLAAMYEERGYARRDIPQLIMEKNLTGIEIDPRAAAMASFALTMKACEYDGRFLRRGVRPRIIVLGKVEFDEGQRHAIVGVRHKQEKLGAPFLLDQTELLGALAHLDEIGSLLVPTEEDMGALRSAATSLENEEGIFGFGAKEQVDKSLSRLEPLVMKYDVVIANPPYLQKSALEPWTSEWVKDRYPEESNDLCTCFIKRGLDFVQRGGYVAEITMHSWMFLSSYEKMRKKIIGNYGIVSMAHLGARAFDAIGGEVVSTTATVFDNSKTQGEGIYFRLVDGSSEADKAAALHEAIQKPDCGWFYHADAESFKSIPGWPIAYWASEAVDSSFRIGVPLKELGVTSKGIVTADNGLFLRLWWEPNYNAECFRISSNDECLNSSGKWFPISKGGPFRKWYGNRFHVINWEQGGRSVFEASEVSGKHPQDYKDVLKFKQSLTWSAISTGQPSFRVNTNCLCESKGLGLFPQATHYEYLFGLVNSSVSTSILNVIAPTIDFNAGDIDLIPVLGEPNQRVSNLVDGNIGLACSDWNAFETSWDFQFYPIIRCARIVDAFDAWETECQQRFLKLKANEEELNLIFARIYHMEDEVPIEVPDDKVSVRRA
ncbi:MAG: BREX-1 system adenine-specific DNA-methyltransferase PglX, partial [Gordonibacter sp.]|uniref:BREX-1 system adenine-specific DNA-methyltransferase PglX n=2 Tax=Gordonibacter sp. TaxID=1968902 RepID=UPI002FCC73A4